MKNLDEALRIYYDHFGENYPLCITDEKSNKEIIEEIKDCIERNKVAEQPSYEEENDY